MAQDGALPPDLKTRTNRCESQRLAMVLSQGHFGNVDHDCRTSETPMPNFLQ